MLTLHPGAHRVEVELPASWSVRRLRQRGFDALPADPAAIDAALDAPLASAPLEERAQGARDALVLAPDRTRPGPWPSALASVARRLEAAGVRRDRITILIATGTHRPMRDDELLRSLGCEVMERYAVLNHDHTEAISLLHLGTTALGTPIDVNRRVIEADVVVSVGSVKPHRVAGWSGGAKLVQPGVTSNATTAATHWLSARYPAPEIIGVAENPVRHEMEDVARRAGLDVSLNVVLDPAYRLFAATAGDFVTAHRAACEVARPGYGVAIESQADLVIAANPPQFRDMWAVGSGPNEAEAVLRHGGAIVTLLDVPEGVSLHHPEIERWGYRRTYAQIAALVAEGQIGDLSAAAHLEHAGGKLWRKALAWYAWAPAIDDALLERLGAVACRTPQDAVDRALAALPERGGLAYVIDGDGPWEFLVEPGEPPRPTREGMTG